MFQVLLAVALASVSVQAQPPSPSASFQLAAVQLSGAKRYTADDVSRLGGLTVGRPLGVADLQPAADRLISTGLFKTLQYRYVTSGKQLTVVFEIEEAEWTVPVVFDNFVWLEDRELQEAVRKRVPSFDGTSPATAGAPDLIRDSLQEILISLKGAGTVTFVPHTDLKTKAVTYLFSVRDPAPKVCAFTVDGASAERQKDVSGPTQSLVGTAYSRFYTSNMAQGTLLDLYHRHGHWKAAFSAPRAAVAEGGCQGVNVTLPVNEGPVFTWEGAEWSGNAAVASANLDSQLGMRRGELADGAKINAALSSIAKGYGGIGHVLATTSLTPRLDEASRSAVFEIKVTEGPQFRMGTVQVVGLTAAAAEAIQKRFPLAAGAIYDLPLAESFFIKEVLLKRTPASKAPVLELDADRGARVINVRIVFP